MSDAKKFDITDAGNGGTHAETDDEFRERWRQHGEAYDRDRALEHRIDFVIAEVRDLRRSLDEKLTQLAASHKQTHELLKSMNDVFGRFMALSNDLDRRTTALEKRRKTAARRK